MNINIQKWKINYINNKYNIINKINNNYNNKDLRKMYSLFIVLDKILVDIIVYFYWQTKCCKAFSLFQIIQKYW